MYVPVKGLGEVDSATEVEEIERLIGKEKNILCIIKGTVEVQNRARLERFSKKRNIPVVVFKEADGRNVYSLTEAFKSAIIGQEMFINLPAVEAGDIGEEYKKYRNYFQILSGA